MSLGPHSVTRQKIEKKSLLSGYNSKAVFKQVAQKIYAKPLEVAFVASVLATALGELFNRDLSGKWYAVVFMLLSIVICKEVLSIIAESFLTPDDQPTVVEVQGKKKLEEQNE